MGRDVVVARSTDEVDLAEVPGLDQSADLDEPRVESTHEPDLQLDSGVFHDLQRLGRRPDIERDGLLTQHGNRSSDTRSEVVEVTGRGRGDDDGVGLAEHSVAVGQGARRGRRDGSFHRRRIGVVHNDVDTLDPREVRGMRRPDPPESEHANDHDGTLEEGPSTLTWMVGRLLEWPVRTSTSTGGCASRIV